MSILLNLIVLTFLFCKPSQSSDYKWLSTHPAWAEWDKKCFLLSQEFKKQFPEKPIDSICSIPPSRGRDFADGNLMSFRHLHAILGEVFYSKRLDRRHEAFNILENFHCQNFWACKTTFELLDREIKKNTVTRNKEVEKLIEKLALYRKKTKATLDQFSEPFLGLCLNPMRERWIEMAYENYCPPGSYDEYFAKMHPSSPPLMSLGQDFIKEEIERESQQAIMSSSRVSAISLDPITSCQGQWKVKIECDQPQPASFEFQCRWNKNEKISKTLRQLDPKIECKAL